MTVAQLAALACGVSLAAALATLDTARGWSPTSWSPAGRQTGGAGRAGWQRWLAVLLAGPATARYLAAGVLVTAVGLTVVAPPKAAAAGALAAAGSAYRDRRRGRAHRRGVEAGMPALARSLADALRGGASIRGALSVAGEDRSVPAGLRGVIAAHAAGLELGAPLPGALRSLAAQGGPTTRLLCGTVVMHLEAGGALAAELDRLATAGDAARSVEHDRVSATAQARATVRLVAGLPLLAMAGAQLASPGFLATVAGNPIALALLLLGLTLEVAAILVARAIVGPTP